MSARLFLPCAVLLLLGAAAAHAQNPAPAAAARLVPANYNPVNDSLGFNWDIGQYGGIGQGSNCFSSGFTLTINGSQFSAQQAMMTPDGSEYFLSANLNGIDITRQIRIDRKGASCRFIETLRNSSGGPQTFTVQIRTQFNNRMQSTLSDTGTPVGAQFGAKDSGLVMVRGGNQSPPQPSVLWMLASPGGKVRPAVRSENNNYRILVTYPVTLAPGASVSLVHAAAQRHLTGSDAKTFAKLFAPLKSSRLVADLPAKERKALANFRASSLSGGEVVLSSLLEKLDVERGPTDVLAIGADTRLKGTASCAALEVETRRGKTPVPFEQVAALIGGPRTGRVLLRDGQALNGRLTARGLKFTLTTGTTMELSAAALDRLVLRAAPGDQPAAGAVWAFVETFDGDRLAVQPDPSFLLRANTAWGVREITADELAGCGPAEGSPLGFFVTLKDGSGFIALLDGREMSFETVLFGRLNILASAIQKIAVVRTKTADDEEERATEGARLTIIGGQVLGGQIDLAAVHFLSPSGVIPVPPNLLRTLHNTSDDGSAEPPVFTAELWGGGSVSGALREALLPVRTGGKLLQVPVGEIMDVVVPSPVTPEGLREKIAVLVRDLGHADWEKREAATRELGELGALARAQLEETQKQTTDAEVRRRAEALLEAIQG